jgi:DNA-directed RNA polymerase subunit K/omega
LEKVGNPNTLVNLVSRRVRQLTSGGGSSSRPLVAETASLGMADIALLEIIEGRITWQVLPETQPTEVTARKRRRG